ncbi:hypothetical protein GH714_018337 [Hevea brasiliensis]|uniref:Bet v I/Major latex protein domain-containing protein n=1 Tax=Hevea brasiliensis TaxID=3981 RepID=A0A6A6MKP0_HEVBR|nr:hypothetical protein GH714_018337 [Hevea brasiliensis]
MGVVTYELEVASPVPPAKLFKAFVLDSDNLIQKVIPKAISNVEILEGDGRPGTVRKSLSRKASSQFKYSKHKIEAIDKKNLKFSHSVIEGDMLMNVIEKITYYIKFQQSPDGGCICKESSNYHTIGDFKLNKDQLKAGKEKALGMFKAVEAYLLANPDAC